MLPSVDRRVTRLEEELARTRQAFDTALDAVPPHQVHLAPAGAWSPARIVWHVAKVERGVARLLQRLDAAIGPMDTVPPGPSLAQVTTLLDHIPFTDRSRKVDAPEGTHAPASVDFVAERSRLAEGRAQVIEAARAAGPRLSLMRYDHPRFGPFTGWQWVLMCARHEERHLLQLQEVLAATR
jgi:hypothetical protein